MVLRHLQIEWEAANVEDWSDDGVVDAVVRSRVKS